MKNTLWIWGITLLCALLGISAMTAMTQHVMRLERENHTARFQKEHAEKIRLALWRMESEASAIVLLENTRNTKKFVEVSPNEKPEHVRSYFEFDNIGNVACTNVHGDNASSNIRQILGNACSSSVGTVLNGEIAAKLASTWGDNSMTDYNNRNAQTIVPQPEREKSIRAEQLKRNFYQLKGQNIEQINPSTPQELMIAGDFRPLWMDGELFLVRTLSGSQGSVTQGVWLEKTILKNRLLYLTNDLFPQSDLIPTPTAMVNPSPLLPPLSNDALVRSPDDALALVSLPWRLEAAESITNASPESSAAMTAMRFAWIGLCVAFASGTALVIGLVRLSERRATFVSSVTHELRTPLTTFQLYTDLLANGMVTDREKQQTYFQTMRREAIRLGHLVENVLAFAKVERGSARGGMRLVKWCDILPTIIEQMEQRLQHAQMSLDVQIADATLDQQVLTNPAALEHILLNLADNAAKYAHPHTLPKVSLALTLTKKGWNISLRDFGPGIDSRERRRIFQPFHKSAQVAANSKSGVGLGLSLSKRLAKSIHASLCYLPVKDGGACFIIHSKH